MIGLQTFVPQKNGVPKNFDPDIFGQKKNVTTQNIDLPQNVFSPDLKTDGWRFIE